MAIPKFSGSTGYRGVVKIEKSAGSRPARGTTAPTNLTAILATSGNFTMGHQPIYSTGVWGAGWRNASERVAYANDIARLDGSVGLEYTAGDVFDAINAMCFTFRGDKGGTYLQVLPDGYYGFKGIVWNTSLSFSASQGQVVTGDFNWTSYLDNGLNKVDVDSNSSDAEVNTPYGAISGDGSSKPTDAQIPLQYNGLYPYWGTDVNTGVIGASSITWSPVKDVISWSANCDAPVEVLKCCGMSNEPYSDNLDGSGAPLAPDYIGLGPMSASCQMEIFKIAGDFSDMSLHKQQAMRFIMRTPQDYASGSQGDTHTYTITLAKVVSNNKSSQIQQGTSWITGSFQFDAIGDFKNPPLDLKSGDPDSE